METMERGSVDEQALEGRMRGMSYGQYVAARYYPTVIVEQLPGGGEIRRSAPVPEVQPGWEDVARRRRSEDESCRTSKPKKAKPQKLCVVCGHPLRGGYRKYCSEECRVEAKGRGSSTPASYAPAMRVDKPCTVCGKTMKGVLETRSYCGPECSRIGNARRQRAWHAAHPAEKPVRICKMCGAELWGRQVKFCSACAGQAELDRHKQYRMRRREA